MADSHWQTGSERNLLNMFCIGSQLTGMKPGLELANSGVESTDSSVNGGYGPLVIEPLIKGFPILNAGANDIA